ncbi:PQQ-binding-like beta-propeller repeat protein [Nonomuraea sp. NPDC048881]|uniref:PQQ-binding-like beta-propeller repeat protein n=1 Tax=Nonomuraea sp. NPDC048881 TaxID=3155030 RepID=UPI0033D5EDE0
MRLLLPAVLLMAMLSVPASAPAMAWPSTQLRLLWQADVSIPLDGYEHALTARDLLVRTSQGVLALGTGDGRRSWQHRLTTASATGWDVTAAAVVIDYQQPSVRSSDRHELIAVASATGRRLWRRPGWSLPPGWQRSAAVQGRAPVFFAWHAQRSTLAGVAAETGRDLWSFHVPAGCTLSGTAARAADAVVLLACGRSSRILRLDPATGRTLTSIPLTESETRTFHAADGVIAVPDGEGISYYDDQGRAVVRHRECWLRCVMARNRNLLLTTYHSGEDDVLAATSWPDGAPVWQVRPAPRYANLLDGGVAVRDLGQGGFPVIDMIDPSGGAVTSYSIPLPAVPLVADGQRIYVGGVMSGAGQTRSVRFAALRRVPDVSGPPWLGGADPGRWPDACGLRPDASFTPAPVQTALSGYTMPKPIACRHTRPDGTELVVRVLWVADDDPDDAARMIDTLGDTYAFRPVDGVGDQAVADAALPSTVYFRSGPVVASMTSGHLPLRHRLLELAGFVAARLRGVDDDSRRGTAPPGAPSRRLTLVHLPGTRVTLAQPAVGPSPVAAYLLDGHPYVRERQTFTRLDPTMDALSPNGAWGARVTDAYPSHGRDPVTILDTATRSTRKVPTVEAPMGVDYPVWSPDGRNLLLTAKDAGTITGFVVIDLAAMRSRFVRIRHGGRYAGSFRWGADSSTVAVQSGQEDDIEEDQLDVTFFTLGGTVEHRYKDVGKLLDRQNWTSPSGRIFTTRCVRPAGQICAWRVEDGALLAQIPANPDSFVAWYDESHILGWTSLSSRDQDEAITILSFLGAPGGTLARARGHDGLQLIFARPT